MKKTPSPLLRWTGFAVLGILLLFSMHDARAAEGETSWVYFGTYTGANSKGIYVSRMDAQGELSTPALAAESVNPAFLSVGPSPNFLYAANEVDQFKGEKSGAVSAFRRDAGTGLLTLLNQQPTGGDGPCHLSVDASGRVLLAANYGGGSVAAFPIKADGSLGERGSFIQHTGSSINTNRQAGPHAHCVVADPASHYALVCDLGLDQVKVYRLDPAKATLTPNDPPAASVKPGSGPRHLVFSSDHRFVYLINEMACTVTVFRYRSSNGALSEVQTISTLPDGQSAEASFRGAEIVIHPSGKFLYTSTRGPDLLSVFSISSASGELTQVQTLPSGGKTPRNFNLDPFGRYLLVANQDSDNVIEFKVDETSGRLAATGKTLTIGNPVCVLFQPGH